MDVQGVKIKIPKGLPAAISKSRQARRYLPLLLYLKSMYTSGQVKYSLLATERWAKAFQVDSRTIRNHLSWLKENNFISETENGDLKLCSYDSLCARFHFAYINRNYYVKEDFLPSLKEWFITKFMFEKKSQGDEMFYRNVRNAGIKRELQSIVGSGYISFREAVRNSQILSFASNPQHLDENELAVLNWFNPDNNLNYRSWSELLGYNSIGGFSYLKRKLVKAKMITVEKRIYEIDAKQHSTYELRKTQIGSVFYSRHSKKLMLQLCDKITVLV